MQASVTEERERPAILESARGRVLAAAAVAGGISAWFAYPTLFGGRPAGLGVTLLLVAPVGVLVAGGVIGRVRPSRIALVHLVAAIAVLTWLTVRAAPGLVVVDLLAAVGLVSLGTFRYVDASPLALMDHVRIALAAPFAVMFQPFGFLRDDLRGTGAVLRTHRRGMAAVLRGLAIAAGPVIVFGVLLASADAVFSDLLGNVFGFDLGPAVRVGSVVLLVAWVTVGLLRYGLGHRPLMEITRDVGFLGSTELITVLGVIPALFALFVGVQFAYLFGGVDTVLATSGLTRAEYYRQGFFQLVTVAALVTVMVLVLDWWHRAPGRSPHRVVTALFETIIGCTAVMVVSAFVRLQVYVDAFGLSHLRVYTAAFVVWVAALLGLLAVLMVTGRRDRFASGAVVAAFVVVMALNVVNPDALIASVNIERHQASGAELDLGYLGTLSEDAVPAILTRATGADCTRLVGLAGLVAGADDRGGIRTYNTARWGADAALASFPGC